MGQKGDIAIHIPNGDVPSDLSYNCELSNWLIACLMGGLKVIWTVMSERMSTLHTYPLVSMPISWWWLAKPILGLFVLIHCTRCDMIGMLYIDGTGHRFSLWREPPIRCFYLCHMVLICSYINNTPLISQLERTLLHIVLSSMHPFVASGLFFVSPREWPWRQHVFHIYIACNLWVFTHVQ